MTNGKKLKMLDMISKTVEDSDYYVEVTPKEYEEESFSFKIIDRDQITPDRHQTCTSLAIEGDISIEGHSYFNGKHTLMNSKEFFKLMEAYMMIPLMIKDKWDVEIEGW